MRSLCFLVLFAFCNYVPVSPLQGKWKVFDLKDYNFDVKLLIVNNKVTGDYCAYPIDESRMDCSTDESDKCEIFGTIARDTGFIKFVSCYSGDTGKAVITAKNGVLYWRTTYNPYGDVEGSEWNGVPLNAKLKKEIKGQ
jgi:hypothetical protein